MILQKRCPFFKLRPPVISHEKKNKIMHLYFTILFFSFPSLFSYYCGRCYGISSHFLLYALWPLYGYSACSVKGLIPIGQCKNKVDAPFISFLGVQICFYYHYFTVVRQLTKQQLFATHYDKGIKFYLIYFVASLISILAVSEKCAKTHCVFHS